MKVLIVSNNPFSRQYNNGKTLESLFSWLPQNNIAQLFFHPLFKPDFSFCKHYYRISDFDIIRSFFFHRKKCGRVISQELYENVSKVTYYRISSQSKIIGNINIKNFQIFREWIWKTQSNKFDEMYLWVKNFSPDIIFFVAGDSIFAHKIVWEIVKKLNCKLLVYFTDDYVLYPRPTTLLKKYHQKHLMKVYKKTILMSRYCFSIGELMGAVYQNKYNKNFIPIMNSVEFVENLPAVEKCNNLCITYLGNLGLGRWNMIIRIAQVLLDIKNRFNLSSYIRVYTGDQFNVQKQSICKKLPIEYKGFLPKEAINNAILESDMLLHIESDDSSYRNFTRLSVSTKIPEYLASNRPIVGFGPIELASMRLLSENNIGYVINSEASYDDIENEFYRILSNYNDRLKMAQAGLMYAKSHFEIKAVQSVFSNFFINV